MVTRPMVAADAQALRDMHERCSAETLRSRYFGPMPRLGEAVITLFTDPAKGVTLVTQAGGEVVAMSNLMDLEPGVSEVAFLIEDRWQGYGLGTALMGYLMALAPMREARQLAASVYSTNRAMLAVLKKAGAVLPPVSGMILDVTLPVGAGASAPQNV